MWRRALRSLGSISVVMAVVLAGSSAAAQSTTAAPRSTTEPSSTFRSAEDGWLDVSSFLDDKYGFLPVVIPITEPAVGYGAAGGLMFLGEPLGESRAGFDRPDITMVGALATENGSWGVVAGDVRHWLGDRLQTQAGLTYLSINLDFHGIGKDRALSDHPLRYNLAPKGIVMRAKYRLGESMRCFWHRPSGRRTRPPWCSKMKRSRTSNCVTRYSRSRTSCGQGALARTRSWQFVYSALQSS